MKQSIQQKHAANRRVLENKYIDVNNVYLQTMFNGDMKVWARYMQTFVTKCKCSEALTRYGIYLATCNKTKDAKRILRKANTVDARKYLSNMNV